MSGNFIQWPTNHKAQTVVQKFNCLRGEHSFPGVFGAIDGCHISILAPWEKRTNMPKLNRTMFYNRKQVPTVLLQVRENEFSILLSYIKLLNYNILLTYKHYFIPGHC